MEQQVSEEIKAARSGILLEQEKKMSEEFREYYIGKETQVLLEEAFTYEGKNYFTGYTKEYVKVAVETAQNLENCFVKGKITGQLTGEVYLMVEF